MPTTDSTPEIGHSDHGLAGCCASLRLVFHGYAPDSYLLEADGNIEPREPEAYFHAPAIRFQSWRPSLP